MPRRRDPNFTTGHLCRFCGQLVPWGQILRLIRVDPDTPPFMLAESACHADCLGALLRPEVELTFHRHWNGKAPMPDDDADILGKPCAICAKAIDPPEHRAEKSEPGFRKGDAATNNALVRLRVQRPAGTVKAPEFDEQSLPFHFDCLAEVSTTRLF
jgi:hypothetical protein